MFLEILELDTKSTFVVYITISAYGNVSVTMLGSFATLQLATATKCFVKQSGENTMLNIDCWWISPGLSNSLSETEGYLSQGKKKLVDTLMF